MIEEITDQSSQKILSTAKTLFWKHGIKRVSVEEICEEAGVSKMTFYRKFKNKTELVHQLLTDINGQAMLEYKSIMAEEIPFPEKVKKIILLEHQWTIDISKEFMADVYRAEDESLKKLMESSSEKSMRTMRKDFTKAQKEGWIRSDLKMDSIFYLLSVIQEILLDPKFLAMHKNLQDAIMEMVNFFFYGVMSQKESKS